MEMACKMPRAVDWFSNHRFVASLIMQIANDISNFSRNELALDKDYLSIWEGR